MLATLTSWLLGVLFGMRHALEPDHLTAVSTLAAEERHPARGALLGAFWGLGHSLSLLVVGVVLALLHAEMPAKLAELFELGVAIMLVGLGVRALKRAVRDGRDGHVHAHAHAHLPAAHTHAAPVAHVHVGGLTFATRSLLIGIVHGLAGSGALTALVLANLPSTSARLAYITLFGIGSVVGMALLSGLAGWPLQRFGRSPRAARMLAFTTGLLSTGLGIFWGAPIVWSCLQ